MARLIPSPIDSLPRERGLGIRVPADKKET